MSFCKNTKRILCIGLCLGLVLSSACKRGDDEIIEVDPDFVEIDDPDRFLQFLNRQVGMPAGNYKIVAGTETLGASGNFTITVNRDDGNLQVFAGTWAASGGTDETPGGANPDFDFTMPYSGGATISIDSTADACVYLLDSADTLLDGKAGAVDCMTSINRPASKINIAENAQAYYRAIDPDNTRTTLADWQQANGFGTDCGDGTTTTCERHVIFRDTKDLGYGRDMYARRNQDGSFAVYVRNFRVDAIDGLQYSDLNLTAAIANNVDSTRQDSIQWHFGSNAIEFSPYPYGAGEPRNPNGTNVYNTNDTTAPYFTKYFTFKPDDVNDPNTTERRLDVVDLDSRGGKSMPAPCISCHGGMSRPLLPNGDYPPPLPTPAGMTGVAGDTQAQMQVIEVGSIDFSSTPGWQCDDLVEGLQFINQGVLSTYDRVNQQYGGILGYWQPQFAADLIEGWYGEPDGQHGDYLISVNQTCNYLQNNFYDYVPPGWRPNLTTGNPPAGSDVLFREVIAPNCMVCHSRRGVNLGTGQVNFERQDIDFSTYDRFISHADQLEKFIFRKGVMPLGLLNFDAFWDNSQPGRAELLASHLPNFDSFNEDGSIRPPGSPFAVVAAPLNTNVPVTISAEGSSFASTYSWSIVSSPNGSNPSLGNATGMRAIFDTDINGSYELQLEVGAIGTEIDTERFTIEVNTALPVPSSIRFGADIQPVLQTGCTSCHADGAQAGVPLFYTLAQVEGRDVYQEVLTRVNFNEPIESRILRKPSGNHHYGGLRAGFDLNANDRADYDLFLNWILNGAPQ